MVPTVKSAKAQIISNEVFKVILTSLGWVVVIGRLVIKSMKPAFKVIETSV